MENIEYKTNGDGILCMTDCPYNEKIGDSIIKAGSFACASCKYNREFKDRNVVVCRYKEYNKKTQK